MKLDHRFCGVLCAALTFPARAASDISFAEPYSVKADASLSVSRVLAGDWNGDGKIDLAAITGKSVMILEGDGKGGFRPAAELVLEQGPVQAAAADLNHDGRTDLIVYQPKYQNQPAESVEEFVTFVSQGDFQFSPPLRFRPPVAAGQFPPGGPYVLGFLVVDLNLDGKPDLLLTRNGVGADSVALGRGDGTFADPIRGPLTFMVAGAADFNSDGVPDVLIHGIGGSPGPRIYYGRGDGTFDDPVPIDVCQPSVGYCYLTIIDFDADGKPDLLHEIGSWGWVGNVLIFRGNGDGGFEFAQQLPDSFAGDDEHEFILSFADLNADGIPDLIRTPQCCLGPEGGSDNFVYVHPGQGGGGFAPAVKIRLPDHGEGAYVLFVDVNGDGKPDLVATDGAQSLLVYLNTGGEPQARLVEGNKPGNEETGE